MAGLRSAPVLIDTDPGVDDALALGIALRAPELQVVGMTTVCGNVPVEQATRNLYRVLGALGMHRSLPIGQGAARPLRRRLVTATHVHGRDGLGELDRFLEQDGRPRYPRERVPARLPSALEVWARCVRRCPGGVTLVTLGPLTNLAQALERAPLVVRGFRAIIAMGGAIGVSGNVTAAAEFNIYADPDAAHRVLTAGLPLTLVPLDVTERVATTGAGIARLTRHSRAPLAQLFRDATGCALAFAKRVEGRARFPFHDPLAVAVAIDPSLVRCQRLPVAVETRGRVTRGTTVADRRSRVSCPALQTVQVALEVDAARARAFLTERICPVSS